MTGVDQTALLAVVIVLLVAAVFLALLRAGVAYFDWQLRRSLAQREAERLPARVLAHLGRGAR